MRRSSGDLELRANFGLDGKISPNTLKLVERVMRTGRAEHFEREICVPIYGARMVVEGAFHLGLSPEGRGFEEKEFKFAQRCVRWLERARAGRVPPQKPSFQGHRPVVAAPHKPQPKRPQEDRSRATFKRPEVFFRSLHTMVTAGLPLHDSLHFLAESTEDEGGRTISQGLAHEVASGHRLSKAMERFPKAFDGYQLGLVAVGETTGALSQVLHVIAEHLERSQALNRKLKSALVYPSILIAGSLTMMVVAPAWLLEGHFKMLQESGQPLPWLTRVLISWSELCRSPLILLLFLAAAAFLYGAFTNDNVKSYLRRAANYIPALREILQLSTTTRFARSLSFAMKAGVNLLQALPLSIRSTDDILLQEKSDKIMDTLKSGDGLADSLMLSGFFPMSFVQVMVAGEESGKTIHIMEMMANLYELEITTAVDQLTSLLEPMLLLLIGIFTGLVLVATMQPTISLLQAL